MTLEEAVEDCLKIQGWKTRDELVWIGRQAKGAKVVLDVGCWRGRTTKLMASVMSGNSVVIAVDHLTAPYTGETARNEIVKKEGSLRIMTDFLVNLDRELSESKVIAVFLDGDEARWYVKQVCNSSGIDFCWLDGDHAYHDVVSDIKAYLPLMRPGGVFAGHDYEPAFPDVVRAVNELLTAVERGPGTAWFYRVPKEG